MGDIDEFDRKTGMHHFLFPDNEEEWLKVEANPFRSYLSHHKFLAAQFSQQSRSETPQTNNDYHALLDLPSIHVDERDDVNAFDATAAMRHDPDEQLFQHDVPFRFGVRKIIASFLSRVALCVPHPYRHDVVPKILALEATTSFQHAARVKEGTRQYLG